jgi:hypothetical protein
MQNGNWNQGMDSSEFYSRPFVFKVTQTCNIRLCSEQSLSLPIFSIKSGI